MGPGTFRQETEKKHLYRQIQSQSLPVLWVKVWLEQGKSGEGHVLRILWWRRKFYGENRPEADPEYKRTCLEQQAKYHRGRQQMHKGGSKNTMNALNLQLDWGWKLVAVEWETFYYLQTLARMEDVNWAPLWYPGGYKSLCTRFRRYWGH